MSNFIFTHSNDLLKDEKVALELQFFYFEYMKRNMLLTAHDVCKNIHAASINVFGEFCENIDFHKNEDILRFAIQEYFFLKNGIINTPILIRYIKKTIREFEFLYNASIELGYYAHKAIIPYSMEEVLSLINEGKEVADFYQDTFFKVKNQNIDSSDLHEFSNTVGGTKINITINIGSDDFSFCDVIDDISYQIALSRLCLANMKKSITLSKNENIMLIKRNIPDHMTILKQSSPDSRAIGLLCWDIITGIYENRQVPYRWNKSLYLPDIYPSLLDVFEDKSKLGHTTRSLLFDLVEKKLLKNFHGKDSPCDKIGKSCIYIKDGKKKVQLVKGAGTKERMCAHYDSCIRSLNGLINHANKSVQKIQIIPI